MNSEEYNHSCVNGIPGKGGWEVKDAQGIYLTKVCELCEEEKLSMYEPWVISGYGQEDIDESLDEIL